MASMIDGRLRSCCAQHGNGVHGHVEKARGQDLRARGLRHCMRRARGVVRYVVRGAGVEGGRTAALSPLIPDRSLRGHAPAVLRVWYYGAHMRVMVDTCRGVLFRRSLADAKRESADVNVCVFVAGVVATAARLSEGRCGGTAMWGQLQVHTCSRVCCRWVTRQVTPRSRVTVQSMCAVAGEGSGGQRDESSLPT